MVGLCLAAASGNASHIALDLAPNSSNLVNHTSAGWKFLVNETIQVTSLLFFDALADGLYRSHPVGIIEDSSEELIFEATVETSDLQLGVAPWREHVVLGPTLLAGHTYWIVAITDTAVDALAPKDDTTYDPVTLTTIPQITYLEGGYGDTPELLIPGHKEETFFGPSFSAVIVIPEPSPGLAVAAAIGGLLIGKRLRARRQKTKNPISGSQGFPQTP
jgi:hypothetical protein